MRRGLSPLVALAGVPRIHSASREARDTGSAARGDVRLGVPLGARGARHRLGDQGVRGRPGWRMPPGVIARRWRPSSPRRAREARRSTRPASSSCRLRRSVSAATGSIESCRRSPRRDAAQAAESFVVFFQALVPTLSPEPAREVKATFFRLVPTLVQMAWEDTAEGIENRRESREALALLETILLEVSSVRLAPVESGLLFKSPRPARDADRRRRVDARARRGRGAAAPDPAQEPRGAIALPPDGGGDGAAGVPARAARSRHAPHPGPGRPRRARRLRPAAGLRGGRPRAARARCSCRCSCRTSRS